MGSAFVLCDGVEFQRISMMERYVSILVWKCCLSVEFGFISVLLLMAFALCCSLHGMTKIMVVVHG